MSNDLKDTGDKIHVAEVVHHGDKLTVPAAMPIKTAIELLMARMEYLEKETVFSDTFDAFPWDGAVALERVLERKFGWAQGLDTPGMFGSSPPQRLTVDCGVDERIDVPWGRLAIPGISGALDLGMAKKDGRVVFSLGAKIKRKDEATVREIFNAVHEELAANSIYRGKALRLTFSDDDGDALVMPGVKFIDLRGVNREQLLLNDDLLSSVETNLLTPIERVRELRANGISIKRGVLFSGTYGTGKTLAATVAASVAQTSGVTYLYIPKASDLAAAIQFAKQYSDPACVIFCEDIDREVDAERDADMDEILNLIDGIDTKTGNIIVVLTTNDLDSIHEAMLRPGRLDAVIDFTPPDSKTIEKLLRFYGASTIKPTTNLNAISKVLAGNIPAVVAEVVKRAKLAQLKRQPPGIKVVEISEEALLESAQTMQRQIKLLSDRIATEKAPTPQLEQAFTSMVVKALNGGGLDLPSKLQAILDTTGQIHDKVC